MEVLSPTQQFMEDICARADTALHAAWAPSGASFVIRCWCTAQNVIEVTIVDHQHGYELPVYAPLGSGPLPDDMRTPAFRDSMVQKLLAAVALTITKHRRLPSPDPADLPATRH